MCGISGITTNNESLVRKMILNTSHRGPDNSGIYSDTSVTLGHCRLSIIDLKISPFLYASISSLLLNI